MLCYILYAPGVNQGSGNWGEPERAPGVMMSTALACVRACVRTYVPVGEACLGTSAVRVAENERIDRHYM